MATLIYSDSLHFLNFTHAAVYMSGRRLLMSAVRIHDQWCVDWYHVQIFFIKSVYRTEITDGYHSSESIISPRNR